MSADNWDRCPRCAKRRAAEIETRRTAVEALYGHVTIGEFDQARRDLATLEAAVPPKTLREDYHIGVNEDGVVVVKYGNHCRECGLETSFTHRHQMEI